MNSFDILQEEKAELDEILAKRAKTGKQTEEKTADEKTTLHSMTLNCLKNIPFVCLF